MILNMYSTEKKGIQGNFRQAHISIQTTEFMLEFLKS